MSSSAAYITNYSNAVYVIYKHIEPIFILVLLHFYKNLSFGTNKAIGFMCKYQYSEHY